MEKLSKEKEEKRLNDFEKIAQNWDKLPEYARGKLDGMITTYSMLFLTGDSRKVG